MCAPGRGRHAVARPPAPALPDPAMQPLPTLLHPAQAPGTQRRASCGPSSWTGLGYPSRSAPCRRPHSGLAWSWTDSPLRGCAVSRGRGVQGGGSQGPLCAATLTDAGLRESTCPARACPSLSCTPCRPCAGSAKRSGTRPASAQSQIRSPWPDYPLSFMQNPAAFLKTVAAEQEALVEQLERARQLLPEVTVSRDIKLKIRWVW